MPPQPSDKSAVRDARQKAKAAEKGDTRSATDLARAGTKDDDPALSVEQEMSEGPEGRGLPR